MGRLTNAVAAPLFIVLLACSFNACSNASVKRSSLASSGNVEYTIQAGDILIVKSEAYPDFDQNLIVDPDGKVAVQALGNLRVVGLSAVYLERVLNRKYSRLFSDPDIELSIEKSDKFSIYFGGDVKKPGVVQYRSNLTIGQGLILAGGTTAKDQDYEIHVFRNRGRQGSKTYSFQLNKKSKKGDNSKFRIAPYDVIFVKKTRAAVVESNSCQI